MKYWILVVLTVIVTAPAFGANWVKHEDLNRDGIREKIVWKEQRFENYYLGTMTISRKGKIVFQAKDLYTDYYDIRFSNLDSRFSGKEIIRITKSPAFVFPEGKWDPNYWAAEIYRWDGSCYVLFWIVGKTTHKYVPGQFDQIVEDTKWQKPQRDQLLKQAESFVQAIRAKNWSAVDRLLDPDKNDGAIALAEVKTFALKIDRIERTYLWTLQDSRHDSKWKVLNFRNGKDYGIMVISPRGINKFAVKGGLDWD